MINDFKIIIGLTKRKNFQPCLLVSQAKAHLPQDKFAVRTVRTRDLRIFAIFLMGPVTTTTVFIQIVHVVLRQRFHEYTK